MEERGLNAEVHINSVYHEAIINFNPIMVVDRQQWVSTLIHECVHILMAPLVSVSEPPDGPAGLTFDRAKETSTSHIEHVMTPLFSKTHGKEMKKWL